MQSKSDLFYFDTPTKPRFSKRQFSKYYFLNDSESDLDASDVSQESFEDTKIPNKPTHKKELGNRSIPEKLSKPVLKSDDIIRKHESIEKPIPCLDWENYHRLNVIHNFMDEMEYSYPSICTVGFIGTSLEGRDLKILKISNSVASNAAVWMDAGIHAREWIAPAVNTYIANHIAKNFNTLPAYLTNKDWYFLPVVNPDGYEYSHTVNRMWRKNRAWHGGQCLGVDLNRNFSYGWGGSGSSDNPTHAFYRGPEPFSEPESSAMRSTTKHFQNCKYSENNFIKSLLNRTVSTKITVAPLNAKTQVWEIRFTNEGQRLFMKTLDTAGAINIWKEEHSTMDVMVEGPRASQVAGMLHEREIPYAIAVGDVNVLLEREQGTVLNKLRRQPSANRNMDWHTFHRLDVIYEFMENLAKEYPYLCTVMIIGKSVEGRDLKLLKISNGDSSNPGVWLDGTIHPREWISAAVVTYIANQLVRNFQIQPDSVRNKDWYILPVMNPDGYEYTHTFDRMWRKNRARYGECVGVDLNRNFSYGWGEKGEEGSSDDPGNIFFRGSKAFSEPETSAVKRLILESPTTFKVFLSFHSYGEVIIFPWGYIGDPCPDYIELLEGGTAMAKAIFETSGHTYKVGSTKDLMYYAAGNSIDWSYGVANIPYSYMVELRGKQYRFLLPREEIIPSAREAMSGVIRLMDFVDKRTKSVQSCVCSK
ncbi:carboxypeptidase A4-like [Pieris rapae]|uniref:carboxypeptidase A4-like n=1 Tax=Pieris rapae TaxID=64459 RepID=UPI001E27CB25|nr:carboxypeptidase A4-like [Pieris rapae]